VWIHTVAYENIQQHSSTVNAPYFSKHSIQVESIHESPCKQREYKELQEHRHQRACSLKYQQTVYRTAFLHKYKHITQ